MNLNLADSLRLSCERRPSATAILGGDRRIDYAELYELSLRFAGVLESLDIEAGQHIAFLLPNVPEFTVCYFGCHAAGTPVAWARSPRSSGVRSCGSGRTSLFASAIFCHFEPEP